MTDEPDTRALPIGYFAASTSGGVALRAAAVANDTIHAVVSLGGHPDLAADLLTSVTAATLLLVGSRDHDAVERVRRAATMLRCPHRVTVVDGAGGLFAEPGTLETASRLATEWFTEHLTVARRSAVRATSPAPVASNQRRP